MESFITKYWIFIHYRQTQTVVLHNSLQTEINTKTVLIIVE